MPEAPPLSRQQLPSALFFDGSHHREVPPSVACPGCDHQKTKRIENPDPRLHRRVCPACLGVWSWVEAYHG